MEHIKINTIMANIDKLNYTFADGQTTIHDYHLNDMVGRINQLIDAVGGVTPTPTQTVATPTISINGTTATISCSTSGATIYYTTNGNTPTTGSTQYSSPITLSGACTIKAIAVKSGMNNSQVASQSYTPSSQYSQEAQAVISKFANMSTANKDKVATFVDTLVSAGVYSKINYLMIPMLAGSVTEGVQNVLSSATPPSISNAEIANGGLRFTGPICIDLKDMMVGTPDYANYGICFKGNIDTTQTTGNQRRILTFGAVPAQGSAPEGVGQFVGQSTSDSPIITYTGYGASRNLSTRNVICHNDTTKKEFYITSGSITSADDTTTINVEPGIYLGSWVDDISTSSYRSIWHGTSKLFIFTNLLSETELTALENAVTTFMA